jgi:hypothetical protein
VSSRRLQLDALGFAARAAQGPLAACRYGRALFRTRSRPARRDRDVAQLVAAKLAVAAARSANAALRAHVAVRSSVRNRRSTAAVPARVPPRHACVPRRSIVAVLQLRAAEKTCEHTQPDSLSDTHVGSGANWVAQARATDNAAIGDPDVLRPRPVRRRRRSRARSRRRH